MSKVGHMTYLLSKIASKACLQVCTALYTIRKNKLSLTSPLVDLFVVLRPASAH